MVVLCKDEEQLRGLMPRLARRAVTYGLRNDSDFRIEHRAVDRAADKRRYSHFGVEYRGKSPGGYPLQVPGHHNLLNATAALAVGAGLDLSPDQIPEALESFRGVYRRFP